MCLKQNYIRYTDDFIIASADRAYLCGLIPVFRDFLSSELKLELHPRKVILRPWRQGIDYLGYVSFPHHMILRQKTGRRMIRNISRRISSEPDSAGAAIESYLGILSHCRGYGWQKRIAALPIDNSIDI